MHRVVAPLVCIRLPPRDAFLEAFEFLIESQRDPGGAATGTVVNDFDASGIPDDAAPFERGELIRHASNKMPNASAAG